MKITQAGRSDVAYTTKRYITVEIELIRKLHGIKSAVLFKVRDALRRTNSFSLEHYFIFSQSAIKDTSGEDKTWTRGPWTPTLDRVYGLLSWTGSMDPLSWTGSMDTFS